MIQHPDKWFNAWFVFAIVFNIALFATVIYVAHHFITKHW